MGTHPIFESDFDCLTEIAVMTIIKEYRVVLPITVDEYQVAQLYSVAESSKNETGGGEGIEVVKNEPYTDHPLLGGKYTSGQYTYKIYHLSSKVPRLVRMVAPKGSLEVHEEAWNAYPYCKTVLTNPGYMKDDFYIKIETLHAPGNGDMPNAHELQGQALKDRKVVTIDIANDPVRACDYKATEDPKKIKSEKTGRGPLVEPDWMNKAEPAMPCYKLVTMNIKFFGLQTQLEKYASEVYQRL